MNPKGTIVFSTVGRPQYGFDVFSLNIPTNFNFNFTSQHSLELRLTDGVSINFNGQFTSQNDKSLIYISERTGSPQIYITRPNKPTLQLPSPPDSLFHDRPIIQNGQLYFISAHEPPRKQFNSWAALYSTNLNDGNVTRLTPYGVVDYSPSISPSGKFIAVASYGSRPWTGEFHELQTDIVVFEESDPSKRAIVSHHGGWPTWGADDSCLYFHRLADDGWWSIFKINLQPGNLENFEDSDAPDGPLRVTPPGVHVFTPAAMRNGRGIVVATRRHRTKFRHIEIFDLVTNEFNSMTELINPDFHHYNPFVSPDSTSLGYHRFRGDSLKGDLVIPHLEFIPSPSKEIRIFRLNGFFPSSSPDGNFIAFNPDFSGLKIVKSDGSKKWTLIEGQTAFYNSWSPAEKNVIFTSIGPIFEKPRTPVQIARVSFDIANLENDNHELDTILVDIKILTNMDTGNNAFPACSPDGKFLVFRSGRSGHKNLYILDAVSGEFEGGSVRRLTYGECIDTMPHWSPDGKLIAFSSNRHNPENINCFSIYLVHPDGTGLRRIHVAGTEEADRERINHVCFSPDGEWLLFTANLDGVVAEPVSLPNQFQPYGDLYVVRLDGSGLRRMTGNGYENGTPTWHCGAGVDLGGLGVSRGVGDKLEGRFDEPLWIRCDL